MRRSEAAAGRDKSRRTTARVGRPGRAPNSAGASRALLVDQRGGPRGPPRLGRSGGPSGGHDGARPGPHTAQAPPRRTALGLTPRMVARTGHDDDTAATGSRIGVLLINDPTKG